MCMQNIFLCVSAEGIDKDEENKYEMYGGVLLF